MTKLFASALALTIGTTGAWAANHENSETAEDTTMMESSDTEMANDNSTMNNADTQMADSNMLNNRANLIRTRDITGGNIYTMNAANDEWSMDTVYDEVGADWNDIGEIEDIVLDHSGQMVGIVAEVGGFLDIADKHVMLPVQNVNLVAVDDTTYAFVTDQSEEELEAMESVDEGFWN